MTQTQTLMGSGIPAAAARHIIGTVASGLTATGTTQADALLINDISEFTTVASGTGALIPANLSRGDNVLIYNGGANALTVYPPVGESINALSANAGFSVAANKLVKIFKVSNTRWASLLTA